MFDVDVKGHRKHLDWRMHVLSLREIYGWSANKITQVLQNRYQTNDISQSGILSFVKKKPSNVVLFKISLDRDDRNPKEPSRILGKLGKDI